MEKKRVKKYALNVETLRNVDLERVNGALTTVWSCPTTDPCAVSRGFSNCGYCDNWTAVGSTCITCPV